MDVIYINSGDLKEMKEFDMSILNGLLSVCSGIDISHNAIHLWNDMVHTTIFPNAVVLHNNKRIEFEEMFIECNVSEYCKSMDFTIINGDTEVYFSLVMSA